MSRTHLLKRIANEEYARRFPRRDRKARKKIRRARTEARELAWLTAMGIPRDTSRPLTR